MFIKFALAAAAVYLIFAVFLYTTQRSLLYYPSAHVPTELELASIGLRHWPSTEGYRGFSSLVDPVNPVATVVFFHGNASLAHDRVELAGSLLDAGFNVILAEYPGYGQRSGAPTEAALVADALESVRLARDQFGLPVYLWGESLGSGVAAAVIAKLQHDTVVEGVVLQAPFSSLVDVAQHHYWYLPARWLIKDKFKSAANLQHYTGRVALLVAEYDNVVPARFGYRLFESLTTDK
ncbi:MAG: alpha/beta fold hydrolase, partial [Pseudomonadota bacterium]